MAVGTGDMQSIGVAGWWITTGGVPVPTTPTLTVTNDGDGDAVTATVAGDAAATNTLYYRAVTDNAWTTGNNRSGDGTIAATGLTSGTQYTFIAVSTTDGANSLPSLCVTLVVTGSSTKTLNITSIRNIAERGAMMVLDCVEAVD